MAKRGGFPGGMPGNMNNLMKQAQRMQRQMEEQQKELEEKYNKLLRESAVSKNKAKLVALGYEESLADETAEAMADGNLEKVFANQKKHLTSFEKRIRAAVSYTHLTLPTT